jgi:hypothetical protein
VLGGEGFALRSRLAPASRRPTRSISTGADETLRPTWWSVVRPRIHIVRGNAGKSRKQRRRSSASEQIVRSAECFSQRHRSSSCARSGIICRASRRGDRGMCFARRPCDAAFALSMRPDPREAGPASVIDHSARERLLARLPRWPPPRPARGAPDQALSTIRIGTWPAARAGARSFCAVTGCDGAGRRIRRRTSSFGPKAWISPASIVSIRSTPAKALIR